jgi:MarR family transcriptional regulator, organic hydroperoxide resistance regulator
MPRIARVSVEEASEQLGVPELMFENLDTLLGYHLRRAQGAMHRNYVTAVADLNLTQKQTATLWLISANPGVAQVSVAAALGMDRATMMQVTDRLDDRKLLIRKRSTVDRRRQELYLTPAGIKLLRKVKSRIAAHEHQFTALFSRTELESLVAALKKFQEVE